MNKHYLNIDEYETDELDLINKIPDSGFDYLRKRENRSKRSFRAKDKQRVGTENDK